jgi:alpha-L-rhamnosidase
MQGAYQILVASRPDLLILERGDLWDSGRVGSDQTTLVPYAGEPLHSGQECYWKVRIWSDINEASVWSEVAFWTMGLLTEADWQSSCWIGHDVILENTQIWNPDCGPIKEPVAKPAPFLRYEFKTKGEVQRALLYACGLGAAELHLNGQKIGETTERDPGTTDFNKRVLYVTHDVTESIRSGDNVLGAILGTLWYDMHEVSIARFDTAPWRARPRLRLLLVLHYSEGSIEYVVSNTGWRTADGPLRSDGIFTGEVYDARLEMPGWSAPGFDASKWAPALEVPAPYGKLAALKCPSVKITKTITPVAITEPKPGVYIVNMGQNFAGHTQLRVSAPSGTAITMRYAEVLHPDGTLNQSLIDGFMEKTTPRTPFQQDTYICSGAGEEMWEQRFSYSGFQYVEVTGFPGKPALDNFRGRFAHTALENIGEFSCSNETVNKIQHATRWSYLSNAQSIPTGCTQREKKGWTGDAQMAAETGLMNFRAASFYTKWLDDLSDAQRADGGIPNIVPTGGYLNGEAWPGAITPVWDAAYEYIAWDLYRYCGDTRILKRHYPHLKKYVDMFAEHKVNEITKPLGLGDWSAWKTKTPTAFTSTATLYLDAKRLAQIATILEQREDAEKYRKLADKVKDECNRSFFNTTTGNYANGSQTANSVALFFGLVPDEHKDAVVASLVRNVKQQGHIDAGIMGAKYLPRVLSEHGYTDLAYMIVTRPEMPSWGYWMKAGSTTLWESWGGGSSYNHIMFGDISNWFFQWLAGIAPDELEPGFKHVRIQPTPVAGLNWVKASYASMHGTIRSEWTRESKKFELQLTLPANVTATVVLPGSKDDRILESGAPIRRARGVKSHPSRKELTYLIGSGEYSFQVFSN